jgi:hypothetical protein
MRTSVLGSWLRYTPLVVAVLISLVLLPMEIEGRRVYESSAADLVIGLGPPILIAALPVLPLSGMKLAWLTWVAAALMLAYNFVFGLALGMFYFPAALLLLVSAVYYTWTASTGGPPGIAWRTSNR